MTTLTTHLATLPGRCEHGYHLQLQGCSQCGVDLKFAGQAVASNAHPADRAKVEAAIRQLAAAGKPFSANQARAIHNVRGGVVGAVFSALKAEGVIRACGDETSNEPGTHGHRVYQWVGVA